MEEDPRRAMGEEEEENEKEEEEEASTSPHGDDAERRRIVDTESFVVGPDVDELECTDSFPSEDPRREGGSINDGYGSLYSRNTHTLHPLSHRWGDPLGPRDERG